MWTSPCLQETLAHFADQRFTTADVFRIIESGGDDYLVREFFHQGIGLQDFAKALLCVCRDHTSSIAGDQECSREFKVVAFSLKDSHVLAVEPIFIAGVAVLSQERIYVRCVPL